MIFLLAAPVVLLCALLSRGLDTIPGRIVRATAVYYGVGYIGRSVYLLIVDPAPGFGSLIANSQLLRPSYLGGLLSIAPEAALGLAVLFLTMYWVSRALQNRAQLNPRGGMDAWAPSAVLALAISWGFRIFALLGHDAVSLPGLAGRLTVLATAALGLIVVCTNWHASPSLRVIVAIALIGEVFWSIESASKTPILAAVLFLYLDPNRRRISVGMVIAAVVGVAVAFAVIQPAKVSLASSDYDDNPALILPAQVVARFDSLQALTLAVTNGPGSFLSGDEVLPEMAQQWAPQSLTGDAKVTVGQLWNFRMAGTLNGTNVADGPTAEGYAIFGWLGIVAWNMILGLATALIAWVLARRPSYILCIVALALLAQNTIFEKGVLGLNEDLSTAVQLAVLAVVPYIFLRQWLRRDGQSPRATARPISRELTGRRGAGL